MRQSVISEDSARDLKIKTPLVRRPVYGADDPVTHRIRRWLMEMLLRLDGNAWDTHHSRKAHQVSLRQKSRVFDLTVSIVCPSETGV
jgi:hypothetical protein